ncbi:F-box and associated interaction domains-containing protein [Raphanus sativus]|uniref:F-box protein At3g22650 n=1 Tax=Raphanus sativus TaxID=3726 RepID=A0A6J0L8I1_RAPSA|nr:putative F-box protein At3g22650 [Raphanus sativus]KAJ4875695.1 F-box and associated interaction domains-containing protein [Raphanus sativus]
MSASKSSKRSSLLPFELVEEILYRIPLRSLVRFKSICKQWYVLLNGKRFIYKHFDLSREQFIQLAHHNKSVNLFNLETQAPSCLQGPPEIHRMIHCDGLLLCQCIERDTSKLAVWNPVLRRFCWIERSLKFYLRLDIIHGFGYDNVSRGNYKIMRFNVRKNSDMEIYECKSKVWRSIDAALDSRVKLWFPDYQALSMNGNMYWIAHRTKGNNETEILVQSFDFTAEIFKDIGCGVPFETECTCLRGASTLILSSFGGDRLSLLYQHRRVKIEVWITNKVTDEVVCWSKYLNVTGPDLPKLHYPEFYNFPTYFIDQKTSTIIAWCGEFNSTKEYIDINVYEISDGKIKKKTIKAGGHRLGYRCHNLCYVYVPSLVHLPE